MGILLWIQSFHNAFLDAFFQMITMLGEEYFFLLLLGIIFWCMNKRIGYKLGFILLSNGVLNNGIKEIVNAKRPIGAQGIRSLRVETATGASFPSGHTQSAAAFWTGAMRIFQKKWLYALGIALMLLVGISRMYLGVHWPADVIGGIVIGVVWAFAAGWIFDYAENKGSSLILLVIVIPAIVGLWVFRSSDYLKVTAMLTGFYIGYVIEGRYINFDVKGTLKLQILKLIIGLAGLLIIKAGLKPILPLSSISDFIRYSLLALWITAGATYLFTKLPRDR